ncbi:MAG: hypothetical protein ACFBSD_12320 [Paracoccaceae bacterium]
MTATPKTRYDRPQEGLTLRDDRGPEASLTRRGALDLTQDRAQHRRYASLFEDLQN